MSVLTKRAWSELQDQASLIISKPRFVKQTTPIVQNGQAQAVIVCPKSESAHQAALTLQAQIYAMSQVEVSIVEAPAIPYAMLSEDPLARFGTLPNAQDNTVEQHLVDPISDVIKQQLAGKHLILLGNLSDNPYIASLYRAYLCPVDATFPGKEGYFLYTLCDPWGDKSNRIIIGVSDAADLNQACRVVMDKLCKEGNGVSLPYLHESVLGPAFKLAYPETLVEPTAEYCQNVMKEAKQKYDTRAHLGMMPALAQASWQFLITGNKGFAQLYMDAFQALVDVVNHWQPDQWGAWGFDADFIAVSVIQGWHAIADSPVFDDEDRCNMASHMVAYVGNSEAHARSHRPRTVQRTRQNHYTFASLGLLYGALTFGCCYGLEVAKDWLQMADECFAPQLETTKGTEDCEAYAWLTFTHALRYAMMRPARAYFTSGVCRKMLTQGITCMDNLGYQVPYGDAASWSGSFSEMNFWQAAAWLLNDSGYRPLLEKKLNAQAQSRRSQQFNGYQYDLPPEGDNGTAFTGNMQVIPIEPAYYDTHGGGKIPIEAGFDKVAFRSSLDADSPYLLYDGMNNGSHGHCDANAIIRYTSRKRIWLADADYGKVSANFHNSLLLNYNGQAVVFPAYATLDQALDGKELAYAKSSLTGDQARWTRAILRLPTIGFLVLDQVTAQQSGEFTLSCIWRTVGDAELRQDAVWELTQGDETLRIACLAPEAIDFNCITFDEKYERTNWPTYPYAGPSVKVLRQQTRLVLQTGQSALLANILVDPSAAEAHAALSVAGLQQTIRHILQQADDESAPMQAICRSVIDELNKVSPKRRSASLPGLANVSVPQIPLSISIYGDSDQQRVSRKATAIACCDIDGDDVDEVIIGTEDGYVHAYKEQQLLWSYKTQAAVTALGTADLHQTGNQAIIVGEKQGYVELLSAQGKLCWQQEFAPHMGHPATVVSAFSGRLQATEPLSVLIATESCHIHAYSHYGVHLWRYEVVHAATAACAADVDGDGLDEVVAGSEYWSWHCIKADGKALYRVRGKEGTGCYCVNTCRLPQAPDHPDRRLGIFGGWDGHLTAYKPTGETAWDIPLGDIVRSIHPIGVQPDGSEDLFASSRSGNAYRFNAAGEMQWRLALDGAIKTGIWLPQLQVGVVAIENQLVWISSAGLICGRTTCKAPVAQLTPWKEKNGAGLLVSTVDGRVDVIRYKA
jgi:outer membrane protein assembly factor BamB